MLGPVLRHVSRHTATVWVETDRACTVEVLGHREPTFRVAGHHYALVCVRGLAPGTSTPYEVLLDGERVWPAPRSTDPPSRIRTSDPAGMVSTTVTRTRSKRAAQHRQASRRISRGGIGCIVHAIPRGSSGCSRVVRRADATSASATLRSRLGRDSRTPDHASFHAGRLEHFSSAVLEAHDAGRRHHDLHGEPRSLG